MNKSPKVVLAIGVVVGVVGTVVMGALWWEAKKGSVIIVDEVEREMVGVWLEAADDGLDDPEDLLWSVVDADGTVEDVTLPGV
jgi:hypothetical protein